MTIRDFISANRPELEACISKALNYVPKEASCYCSKSRTNHYHNDSRKLSTEQLRQWILNDESLYNWARSQGVRI